VNDDELLQHAMDWCEWWWVTAACYGLVWMMMSYCSMLWIGVNDDELLQHAMDWCEWWWVTAACYGLEDESKVYEDMSWTIPAHNTVRWWAVVICDEPAVRISYCIVTKHNVGSGSSQTAHIPLTYFRPYKLSTHSWLLVRITLLIPTSVTLSQNLTSSSFNCTHL
jgi:hypothetical protein